MAGNGNNTIYGNGQVGAEGSTGGNNLIIGGTGNDTIYGSYQNVVKKGFKPSNGGEGGQDLISAMVGTTRSTPRSKTTAPKVGMAAS